MSKKRIEIVLLMLAVLMLCTGCWDAIDVEDRDITTAVVVDKTPTGYSFTLEFARISSKSSSNGDKGNGKSDDFSLLKAEGPSYSEAREELDRKADKPIYLGAVNAVIFTNKLAYSGIKEYLFRLRQITDYRKTVDVIVTTESPEALLNMKSEHSSGVGMAIEDTLQNLIDSGQNFHFTLGDALEAVASSYSCYLLPTVAIKDDEIALIGYSVIDDGNCKGLIPIEEAEGIILLKAKDPRRDYNVPCKNGHVTVNTRFRKRKIKTSYVNGKITFILDFYVDSELLYPADNIPISDETDKQISDELSKIIKKDIEGTIKEAQYKYDCDYLGFNTQFRIHYPEEYKKLEWEDEFSKVEFMINITMDHETAGTLDYKPSTEY